MEKNEAKHLLEQILINFGIDIYRTGLGASHQAIERSRRERCKRTYKLLQFGCSSNELSVCMSKEKYLLWIPCIVNVIVLVKALWKIYNALTGQAG